MQVINAYEIDQLYKQIKASREIPVCLRCRQTSGALNSHPLAHFDGSHNPDAVIAYYSRRGHGEGLTNWQAYFNLTNQGFTVGEIEMEVD